MEQSFEWIVTCIQSCTNDFQLDCCRTLIELFRDMYKDEEEVYGYLDKLQSELIERQTFLIV